MHCYDEMYLETHLLIEGDQDELLNLFSGFSRCFILKLDQCFKVYKYGDNWGNGGRSLPKGPGISSEKDGHI